MSKYYAAPVGDLLRAESRDLRSILLTGMRALSQCVAFCVRLAVGVLGIVPAAVLWPVTALLSRIGVTRWLCLLAMSVPHAYHYDVLVFYSRELGPRLRRAHKRWAFSDKYEDPQVVLRRFQRWENLRREQERVNAAISVY